MTKKALLAEGFTLPDAAREVVFPRGVPLVSQGEQPWSKPNGGHTNGKRRTSELAVISTPAEDKLDSDDEKIREQARAREFPKRGATCCPETAKSCPKLAILSASTNPGRKRPTRSCSPCKSRRTTVLDQKEATRRRQEIGPNRLRRATRQSTWQILFNQFRSVIVLLLVLAAAASFAFGKVVDGLAVVVVILINAAIGFITELRAVRSMESLRELNAVMATVRRGGELREIEADQLTPGDIVIVSSGDVVSADLRLVNVATLHVDESLLTGESAPVAKQTEPMADQVPLAERSNMAFSGTAVTRGSGEGVVVAVGMNTELGHIAALAEGVEEERTPLEQQLDHLGRRLVWVTLGIAVLVAVAGLLAGKDLLLIVETAIALAVATVPEGLPIVATVALARGMWRMAQRNAVVNRLAAVETLGATTVICTDKTGTLTENQMTVSEIRLAAGMIRAAVDGQATQASFSRNGHTLSLSDQPVLRRTLEVGMLCNDAVWQGNGTGVIGAEATGEPLDVALLAAGAAADLQRDELLERQPLEHQVAFDSDLKMMATVHRRNGGFRVAVKGAPEAVLDVCTALRTDSRGTTDRRSAAALHGTATTTRWRPAVCAFWRWPRGRQTAQTSNPTAIWCCWAWWECWTRRARMSSRRSSPARRLACVS